MNYVLRLLPILLLLPALALGQESGGEEWSTTALMGQKIGYSCVTRAKRVEDGKNVIETVYKSRMCIKRMGITVEVESDVRAVETEDGKPLRFTSRSKQSATTTISEGVIAGGKIKLRTLVGGVEEKTESEWDPEAVLLEGERILMVAKGFKDGSEYTFKTYSPDQNKIGTQTVKIVAPETREIMGKKRDLFKSTMTTDLMAGMKTTRWNDKDGNEWYSETSAMGLKFVSERATKEDALKDAPAEVPDIFVGFMPKSNVALPRPRQLTTLKLRMERPDAIFSEWKPPAGTQSVVARDDKSVTLLITSAAPEKPATLPIKAEGDLAKFLVPSPSVQCADADIVAKAKELVGEETDALKVAKKLAGWVCKHISKKSMDVAAASAKEVFTSKKGDCSEHAVLLTAMLRAAGIPAKVCSGYLYFKGSWGGHAWSSAWVGKWIDLDGTLGSDVADASRIKFSETEATEAGAMMEGMSGAGFMHGGMKVDIISYTLDGKEMKVGAASVTKGNLFTAEALGFSFEKPEAWTFGEVKDLLVLGILKSGDNQVEVEYVDLPYEMVELETGIVAKALGASRKSTPVEVAGFEAVEGKKGIFIRLSPAEILKFVATGEGADEALKKIKETFKSTRSK